MKLQRTLVMIVVLIAGCFGGIDVTNDTNFNYGYRKGQIYESRVDLYVIYGWDNYLEFPEKNTPKLTEYLQNPTSYNGIKGVLKKKSLVRIEKLSYREIFESSYLDIFARVLNGEYKDELVKLSLVSRIELKMAPWGGFMRKPDPQVLKLVETQ